MEFSFSWIKYLTLLGASLGVIFATAPNTTHKTCAPDVFFHPAQESLERRLHDILKTLNQEDVSIDLEKYIRTWPHTRVHEPVNYQALLTKAFIYGWSRLEQRTVHSYGCSKYTEGEICGLAFDILTYSQDPGPEYFSVSYFATLPASMYYRSTEYYKCASHISDRAISPCTYAARMEARREL